MAPVRAVAKQIGASTKRLRPMLDLVRGRPVTEALNILSLLPSPWAIPVAKVVTAAAANAANNQLMDRESLTIVRITADPARSLKRSRALARGRIGRITKRSSHIIVEVDQAEEEV